MIPSAPITSPFASQLSRSVCNAVSARMTSPQANGAGAASAGPATLALIMAVARTVVPRMRDLWIHRTALPSELRLFPGCPDIGNLDSSSSKTVKHDERGSLSTLSSRAIPAAPATPEQSTYARRPGPSTPYQCCQPAHTTVAIRTCDLGRAPFRTGTQACDLLRHGRNHVAGLRNTSVHMVSCFWSERPCWCGRAACGSRGPCGRGVAERAGRDRPCDLTLVTGWGVIGPIGAGHAAIVTAQPTAAPRP